MAWIKSVEYRGLAGIDKSRRLDLNRDLNIFWGLNGCGKTSLLKILHCALSNETQGLNRVEVRDARVGISTDKGTVDAELFRIHATTAKSQQDVLFVDDDGELVEMLDEEDRYRRRRMLWRWRYSGADSAEEPPYSHRYLPVSRVSGPMSSEARYRMVRGDRERINESEFFDRLFADNIQEVWRQYATQELVEIREIQQQGLADILSAVIGREKNTRLKKDSKISAEQASGAVRDFFRAQNIQIQARALDRLVKEYANDALLRQVVGEIVDVQEKVGVAQAPTRKIEDLIAEMFSGNKSAHFTPQKLSVTAGKINLPLEALSSGEKQLLRLFVECRAAGADTVIIDEPELSMHVDWQHFLLEYMRTVNPDVQIIVATHSPEIMARVSDDKIFEL